MHSPLQRLKKKFCHLDTSHTFNRKKMSGILKVFACQENSRFTLLNIQLQYLLGIAAFLVQRCHRMENPTLHYLLIGTDPFIFQGIVFSVILDTSYSSAPKIHSGRLWSTASHITLTNKQKSLSKQDIQIYTARKAKY